MANVTDQTLARWETAKEIIDLEIDQYAHIEFLGATFDPHDDLVCWVEVKISIVDQLVVLTVVLEKDKQPMLVLDRDSETVDPLGDVSIWRVMAFSYAVDVQHEKDRHKRLDAAFDRLSKKHDKALEQLARQEQGK